MNIEKTTISTLLIITLLFCSCNNTQDSQSLKTSFEGGRSYKVIYDGDSNNTTTLDSFKIKENYKISPKIKTHYP